jgi:hypothetical protein
VINANTFMPDNHLLFNFPTRAQQELREMLREIPNSLQSLRARTNHAGSRQNMASRGKVVMVALGGALPGNMRLAHDIFVLAEDDDGEFLVSEPKYHIHGYGATFRDAEQDFRQVLVDSYELLKEDQQVLSPYLQDQLSYMQSIIVPA